MENNNSKYVPWKVFCWIFGIAITMVIVSYGYLYTQTNNTVQQVQANSIMISRLEERLTNISAILTEIKIILNK